MDLIICIYADIHIYIKWWYGAHVGGNDEENIIWLYFSLIKTIIWLRIKEGLGWTHASSL